MRSLVVVVAMVLLWYAVLLAWLCVRWPGARQQRIKRPGSFAVGTTIFAIVESLRLTRPRLDTEWIVLLALFDAFTALCWSVIALREME